MKDKENIVEQEESSSLEVDEELYSRQLYVIGHDAMRKMMSSKALIIGMDGLGQEIAKNICLAGIKALSIHDKKLVTKQSQCAGFYLSNEDIGTQRDQSAYKNIKTLNKYVKVNVIDQYNVQDYKIVVSVNQDIEFNKNLSEECHNKKVKFIMANTSGLFSQLFCDFNEHICVDKNGQPVSTGIINDITEEGILTLADGSTHSLEDNDIIKIDNQTYRVLVISRNQLKLKDYFVPDDYNVTVKHPIKVGGDFEQVKEEIKIKFFPLKNSLKDPEIVNFDFSRIDRSKILHKLFTGQNIEDKSLLEQFNMSKGLNIAPMCSVVGGLAAQEVLKALSGKFNPIKQFFYYDCAEIFTGENKNEFINTRYSDLEKILGTKVTNELMNLKLFLVGAGAIGCENLKNFVMSGIGSKGSIFVTDMDSIEQSNLNRQFLFKESDVSKMKAESAVMRVLSLNQDFNRESIKSYNLAVSSQTENVFSDRFFQSLDLVSNALDNVEARNYIDQRCIKNRRPMFDAGTLGTKGHVQVVVPFIYESYGSSVDAPENSIPLCTIKSYPNTIEHTIEWALSEFRSIFNETIQTVAEYALNKDSQGQEAYDEAPKGIEGCIKKALSLCISMFSTNIQKLLSMFPEDHVTEDGVPFWSPPKRLPAPLDFDRKDHLQFLFILTASNLFASCYNLRKITKEEVDMYLDNVLSLEEPAPLRFEYVKIDYANASPLEFDKDSWHSDFIYACANLRARNYNIKERSKHFIVGVAGKIIPAIATTTAIVSGLATLEIMRYVRNRTIKIASKILVPEEDHTNIKNNIDYECKNSFLDLSLPFIASTDPIGPKIQEYERYGKKIKFTLWSRIELADCLLKELIEKMKELLGKDISMVSIGSKVVYWTFGNKYDENLKKKISELCDKKEGQLLEYVDIFTEDDSEIESVAIIF